MVASNYDTFKVYHSTLPRRGELNPDNLLAVSTVDVGLCPNPSLALLPEPSDTGKIKDL